ncbi:DUF983 domain-containing protein [Paracoccus sp. JM45]|uniref:DUF983 domain-containing protein n=1 Tax=Paracoccus sp. JM45 TaxID=2283626 RepID=UPI000E6C67A2|nr:DUF983 domain-containing protein [Paracoccus sp. JM45]RJE80127.1 DUF983 domain-containing protein [Paracoccus sp. JM45]
MTHETSIERPTKPAMLRGAMLRCPACGEGKLFSKYLKVNDHCPNCNEALHHQRADDGPAYLTILLVSHLGAPLLLACFVAYRPSAMTLLLSFSFGAIVLSLLLLPVIKGAMVGFQWARRMHGFEQRADGINA